MLITFGELAAGLLLLRVELSLLLAATDRSGGRPAGVRYRHRTAALGCARPVGGQRADGRRPAGALLRLSRSCEACWSPVWWERGWVSLPWLPWSACTWAFRRSEFLECFSPHWPPCWPGSSGIPASCTACSDLSKQRRGTCRGLFVSLFRTIRRDIGLVRGRLHRRGYGRRCGACAGLGWHWAGRSPRETGSQTAVPRWARWPGSPGQNSRTWGR